MLIKVATSLSLIALCIGQIAWVIRRRKPRTGALVFITPSVVFLAGILARFGIGSLIIALTPSGLVLEGEYRQYIVSWLYSRETAWVWLVYVFSAGITFGILEQCNAIGREASADSASKGGWLEWIRRVKENKNRECRQVVGLTTSLLFLYFLSSCISAWTGSIDRGAGYEYWAGLAFKPEALFIAFARLRQIGYFLLPLTWKHSSRLLRVFIGPIAIFPLLLEAIAGGRGAVLYPLIMVFLGYVCITPRERKVAVWALLLVAVIGVAVPYITAYRDGTAIQKTSHRDLKGRLGSFIMNVETERIVYRYMALGREVYACSDGFIFEAINKNRVEKAGLGDLGLESIGKILLPRWVSDDKGFEKGDGARIAKRLIGVKNRNWFPCISTPSDLFRRERWEGVIVGGGLIGAIMWILDRCWLARGSTGTGVESLLVTVLPVTYIQTGIYGTVKELVWQLAWDLPKYLILFWAVGKGVEVFGRIQDALDRRL